MSDDGTEYDEAALLVLAVVAILVASFWFNWPTHTSGEYWGDFAFAAGAVSVSVIISLLFATLKKLFSRKSRFLFTFAITLMISTTLLTANKIYVQEYKTQNMR